MTEPLRLSSHEAQVRGYHIVTSPLAPMYVEGPGGRIYRRCKSAKAHLIIHSDRAGTLFLRAQKPRRPVKAKQLDMFPGGTP